MNDADFIHDVFLSHGAKDKAVVRPLAERLRQDGPPAKSEGGMQKAEMLHSAFVLCVRLGLGAVAAPSSTINSQPSTSLRRAEPGARIP